MADLRVDGWTDTVAGGADRLGAFSARDVMRSALRRSARSQRNRTAASRSTATVIPAPKLAATDPGDRSGSLHSAAAADRPEEILACAETLGIPWRRLLAEEIEAEQRLRRYLSDVEDERPLRSLLKLLPFSCLRSWRVRDRIERLSSEARGASAPDARRQLRLVFTHLVGKKESDKTALAEHLWFAYQRILLLQRVRRAASRSRGTAAERMADVCARARCSFDDAAWALSEEESPKYGDRFDAAVRKVRAEGFQIPRAETEARSLAKLRRIVRASPYLRRAHSSRPRSGESRSGSRARISIDGR